MLNEINTNIQTIYKEVTEKLIPRNIRKGVTILNVDGALEGIKDSYIVDTVISNYSVSKPDNGAYTFTLNSSGYYESNNKGKSGSYALCKVEFNVVKDNSTIAFDCINYAESSFDFGLFSQLDGTLTSNNTADSNAYFSFSGKQSSIVQTVTYNGVSKGKHSIYIKYKKDGSVNKNNDSLQFKVITESKTYQNIYIYPTVDKMQEDITQADGSLGTITDGTKLSNLYKYDRTNETWNLLQVIDYKANVYTTTSDFSNDEDNYGSDFIGVIINKDAEIPLNINKSGEFKISDLNDDIYLDTALTETESYHISNLQGTDEDYYRGNVDIVLNYTSFKLTQYNQLGKEDPDNNYVLEYTSTDGRHYQLTKSTLQESTYIYNNYPNVLNGNWDDRIGQFIFRKGTAFNGLYYKSSVTSSPYRYNTQLYAKTNIIPNECVVYGDNGVVNGTLYNSIDNDTNIGGKLEVYGKLKNILEAEDAFKDKQITINSFRGDNLPITNYGDVMNFSINDTNIKNIELNLGTVEDYINVFRDGNVETLNIKFTQCRRVDLSEMNKLKSLKLSGNIVDETYPRLNNFENLETIDYSELSVGSGLTGMDYMFSGCKKLVNFPDIDTSKATTFYNAFNACMSMVTAPAYDYTSNKNLTSAFSECTSLVDASNLANQGQLTGIAHAFNLCSKLEIVPQFDLSNFTSEQYWNCFNGCTSLNDESLNNILAMCASFPTSISATKTLAYIGLTQEQAEKCTTLSNYATFTTAGWTTGY